MKIIFTAAGDGLEAPLDPRFGRAPKFILFDLDSGAFEVLDNADNAAGAQGVGVQAANAAVRTGASALVTGHCGPNAFRVLAAAGIRVYTTPAATVAAALEAYKAGSLRPAAAPDVRGHWS